MAEVFVRRTTATLLLLVAALAIVCVALLVLVLSPNKQTPGDDITEYQTSISHRKGRMNTKTAETMTLNPQLVDHTFAPKEQEPWEKNIRIPTSTIPYHYDLMLFPNLQTEHFTGRVAIIIGVTEPMDYLVTHVKLMNVTKTELMKTDGMKIELKDYFEYKPNEFWVVKPQATLTPGNYTLHLEFDGKLRGHIVGFYMSEYMTKSGEKRAIATSKFQPTDARRAFPCFDEPSFKSTFKTTLIRPSQGYIALSNMPVEKETANSPSAGFTKVEFEKSVPMVTYLACFIVCDFDYVEVQTSANKPFRVYSTKDQINRTHYARDIGVDILNYFERYFEVEYPLPKQDMIAIPDFVSGAMEHWGLITYRETNLLYDEINSSSYNKQRVAAVVSHELAHMWFGNLVTLKWWDDLWLNEGFASYIEYKGVANYEKDWDMDHQFVTSDLQPVFRLDEILSSHPIVQRVNHPDEITEIFDRISYSKGASVLRMLENFLGPEIFRIGVKNFLIRFKYDNAVTQDLWDDLQLAQSGNLNVTRIMDTWTRQMGFPVLNVKTSPSNQNQLEVTQKRFLIDPDAVSRDDSPFNYKWDIPITFKTDMKPNQQVWMEMEKNKLMIDRPAGTKWIKFNVDQYGYYRVNYDDDLWKELIDLLRSSHELLSPSDRSSLIDDSFSLAAAQQLPYDVAFQVASYLTNDVHYVPWSSAYSHINKIGNLLQTTKAYKFYRKFVLSLVSPHVDRVGWEDIGTHTERRNRLNILSLACSNGHQGCLQGAEQKFRAWIDDPNSSIPSNLRIIVYTYGIKRTGEIEWDVLLDRYTKEINAQEKQKLLYGLTATKEPWIANNFLEIAKNESIVRQQDFFTLLTVMSRNPSGLPIVWSFIRSHWEWMVDRFGLNNRYLGRAVRSVAFRFTTPLQLKELKTFFADYPEAGSGKRARIQALEAVEKNVKWVEKFADPLHMWLEKETMTPKAS